MDGTGREGLRPSPGFEALDAHVPFSCTRCNRSPADLHRPRCPLRLRVDWIRDRSPGTYLRGRSVMPLARPKTRQSRRRPTTPAQNNLLPSLANQQPFSRLCASQLLRSVRVSPRLIPACSVLLQLRAFSGRPVLAPQLPPLSLLPSATPQPTASDRSCLQLTEAGAYHQNLDLEQLDSVASTMPPVVRVSSLSPSGLGSLRTYLALLLAGLVCLPLDAAAARSAQEQEQIGNNLCELLVFSICHPLEEQPFADAPLAGSNLSSFFSDTSSVTYCAPPTGILVSSFSFEYFQKNQVRHPTLAPISPSAALRPGEY